MSLGKSNQQNLGTIKSSNLCTEIIEYSAPDEVAVCNLASLALPAFVDYNEGNYDFKKLHEVTQVVVRNLNKIIEVNDKLSYAVVEPGVTFAQLYNYCAKRKLKVWPSTPSLGWGSVIGNVSVT